MQTTRSEAASPAARRAAVYVRISKDEADDQLGVKRQERLCRELADRLGWSVVEVFADNNLSAFKRGKRRPAFAGMVEAIEAGDVDAVVAYNFDRLVRDDLRGIEDVIDLLADRDVALEGVRSGEFDLSTAHGRAQARNAGVWARLESEKASERLRDKMTELVNAGRPNGGPTPYGYRRTGAKLADGTDTRALVPEPAEAAIVAEAMGRIAAGETLTRVADDLNGRKVPRTKGKPWTLTNLRRLALNGLYAGRRMHHGEDAGPGQWPAIVDEGTWRRAVALLTDESRRRRRSSRRYLLSGGLLVCGKCGVVLRSKPHHQGGQRVATYACPSAKQGGCGGVTIRAAELEQWVAEMAVRRIESAAFARALRGRSTDDTAARTAARLEAELEQLARMHGEGDLSLREWEAMRTPKRRRLAEAQALMAGDTSDAAVGRYAGQVGRLAGDWPTIPLDRRQAILRAVIERVVVAPIGRGHGRRFDSSRVSIKWRE
jgi:site-specific DNA recombinase